MNSSYPQLCSMLRTMFNRRFYGDDFSTKLGLEEDAYKLDDEARDIIVDATDKIQTETITNTES